MATKWQTEDRISKTDKNCAMRKGGDGHGPDWCIEGHLCKTVKCHDGSYNECPLDAGHTVIICTSYSKQKDS